MTGVAKKCEKLVLVLRILRRNFPIYHAYTHKYPDKFHLHLVIRNIMGCWWRWRYVCVAHQQQQQKIRTRKEGRGRKRKEEGKDNKPESWLRFSRDNGRIESRQSLHRHEIGKKKVLEHATGFCVHGVLERFWKRVWDEEEGKWSVPLDSAIHTFLNSVLKFFKERKKKAKYVYS